MGCCPPAGAICGAAPMPGCAPAPAPAAAEGGGCCCWRGSAAAYLQYASAIAAWSVLAPAGKLGLASERKRERKRGGRREWREVRGGGGGAAGTDGGMTDVWGLEEEGRARNRVLGALPSAFAFSDGWITPRSWAGLIGRSILHGLLLSRGIWPFGPLAGV